MYIALLILIPVAFMVVLAVLFLQNDDSPNLNCSLAGGHVFYKITAALCSFVISAVIFSAVL